MPKVSKTIRLQNMTTYFYHKHGSLFCKYWTILGVSITIIILYCLMTIKFNTGFVSTDIEDMCYKTKYQPTQTLLDISSIIPNNKSKLIFFHDTTCKSHLQDKITITARQACAVESAAKMNANMSVYVLFTSPGVIRLQGDESDRYIEALQSYKNVKMMYLNIEDFTEGTSVENLCTPFAVDNFDVLPHFTDILRYVTLYKYGGIGIDFDMIVTQSLEDLPANFAAIQSNYVIGSSLLGFEGNGFGHELLRDCLNYIERVFNGEDKRRFHGKNPTIDGAEVITKLLELTCKMRYKENMQESTCFSFKIFSRDKFYPISKNLWNKDYEENQFQDIINATKRSYAVNTFSSQSKGSVAPLISNGLYLYFAKNYCPKIYKICNKHF